MKRAFIYGERVLQAAPPATAAERLSAILCKFSVAQAADFEEFEEFESERLGRPLSSRERELAAELVVRTS